MQFEFLIRLFIRGYWGLELVWPCLTSPFYRLKSRAKKLEPDLILFIWPSGATASAGERKAAMKAAEQFIKERNYPKSTQVII